MSSSYEYFKEITKIPRPSKKEDKIRNYLISLANLRWLEYKQDPTWNLVIYAPWNGNSNKPPIILQSHMDMVCVKDNNTVIDFEKDSLEIYEEKWFLKAKWTSLWADNWIWVALMLASLDFEERWDLELLFTIDEEQWLNWAAGLDFGLLKWKTIINLDSESEDEICISSAWWARVNIKKELIRSKPSKKQYKIELAWFFWWHSWIEINGNQWNAIKILINFLSAYEDEYELSSIKWWIADNVIPSRVEVIIWIDDIKTLELKMEEYIETIKWIYNCPQVNFKISEMDDFKEIIVDYKEFLSDISELDIWVISMSEKIDWLVQTSINLWIIETEYSTINITYLPRSSIAWDLDNMLDRIRNNYKNWYVFTMEWKYPWWQDDPNWSLAEIASQRFEIELWIKPKILAIHAWLECWLLVSWIWEWAHAISIGPNIYDVHSINEKVEINSISRIEKVLEWILKELDK